jgi:phosphoglycerate kinase
MKSVEEANIGERTRVLVRVDWNLPVSHGKILDDSRLRASLKTIEYIKGKGAVPVIASHFGRDGESIEPVINHARNNFESLSSGVEFLENLRKNPGEEANSDEFVKYLASNAEIYVNEAFSVSHREHASIVGVPKYIPGFAGFDFLHEFQSLSAALNPEHPFFVILGGAKLETKLPLVEKFLDIADWIFVGGAMAKDVPRMPFAQSTKVILPLGDFNALDADEATLEMLGFRVKEARTIVWNGPLGKYESGFTAGTFKLAQMIRESSAKSFVGGGDTLAAIKELQIENTIKNKGGFVSSGGGAMLDFLAIGTLPGIDALK